MRSFVVFVGLSWTFFTNEITMLEAFEQNPKGPIFRRDVTSCILDIARVEFGHYPFLGVSSSFNMSPPTAEIQQMVMEELHKTEKWTIEIVNSDDFDADKPLNIQRTKHQSHRAAHLNFDEKRKNFYYIIIVDTPEEFYEAFSSFSTKQSFNPTAKILIYCTQCHEPHIAEWVLLKLWGQFCTNTAILTTSFSLHHLPVYALELFNPATICGDNVTLNLLGACQNGRITSASTIFIERVPLDLQGCMMFAIARQWPPFVMNVSSEDEPGIEVFTLRAIAKFLNFRINFTQYSRGMGRRVNGTWRGMLARVKQREAIFAIGNIRPDQMIYEDFTLSNSYFEVHMSWVVPKALPVAAWRYPYVIFHESLWSMIFLSILTASITWFFLARSRNSQDVLLRNFGVCLLNGFTMAFGLANANRPAGHLMRLVFITISIFGIIINTIYQGFLIRIFTNPPYEYQIGNIEELFDANYTMGGVPEFQEFYNDSTDSVSWRIFTRYFTDRERPTVESYLRRVAKDRNFSTIVNKYLIRFLHAFGDPAVTGPQGQLQVHAFKKDDLVYPLGMVAQKGFPVMPRVNRLLLVFRENGILDKWESDIQTRMNRRAARSQQDEKEDIKLTVIHLQGVFMFLLLGFSVSGLVFLGEIVWSKRWIQNFFGITYFDQPKKHKVLVTSFKEPREKPDQDPIIPYCN